jgi:poly-gamma-glutamate capsule biosynthesis protein CapA/YwtB (metallophosphatase superfamily)
MKFLFAGDVMLGRLVNQALAGAPADQPWGDTLPLFRAADWRACNLECVLSDRGRPWSFPPKAFHFRSDAKNVAVLKAAGIDAVSLANNHTLDFEFDALFEMLRLLDEAGIRHAGAGADLAEASAPAICEVAGRRIGLIAFTDNEPMWAATESEPGVFHVPIDLEGAAAVRLLDAVRRARGQVDLLVVSAHWGPNWGYRPERAHVPFGRALIDAGADVVFGHSCHVFQRLDVHAGRPILYSAGDFIDDYAVDEVERNDESFLFSLEVDGGEPRRLRLIPTVIRDFQARLARAGEAQAIAAKMQRLCAEAGTRAEWIDPEGCLEIALGS